MNQKLHWAFISWFTLNSVLVVLKINFNIQNSLLNCIAGIGFLLFTCLWFLRNWLKEKHGKSAIFFGEVESSSKFSELEKLFPPSTIKILKVSEILISHTNLYKKDIYEDNEVVQLILAFCKQTRNSQIVILGFPRTPNQLALTKKMLDSSDFTSLSIYSSITQYAELNCT